MKKTLFGLLLSVVAIGGYSTVNAGYDTSCWSGLGTVPTSSYATGIIYGCDGDIPVVSIHNENGSGIIIKAMNEGTGTVKIGSGNDAASFGSHYQWGNSYPFPLEGEIMSGNYQTDASGYGPNTTSGYYESGVFLKGNSTRSSVRNDNLRGGTGDYGADNNGIYNGAFWGFYTGNFTVTNVTDRKVMCPEGYHVPSQGEWNALLYLWGKNYDSRQVTNIFESWSLSSLNYKSSLGGTGNRFSQDLLIPFAGGRSYDDGEVYDTGSYAYYWSSSPYDDAYSARSFYFDADNLYADSYNNRAYAYSVRCFKNSYIELPQALNLYFMTNTGDSIGDEIGSGVVAENTTGATVAAQVSANATKTGYVLEYRYLSGADSVAGFDFTEMSITSANADASGNIYFIAKWTPIKYTISFSGNAADATGTAPDTINAEYDSGDIAPDNTFTMTGYTFTGWNTESNGSGTGYATGAELKNLTTTSGKDVKLYAQWEVNIHKLSFVVDGTNIQSGDVAYSSGISAFLPSEPKKDCNSFAGWTSSVEGLTTTGTMPDSDVTFTANWNYTCSRSSGGGGGGSSRNTEKTTETQTGSKVDSSTKATDNEDNTQDSSAKASEGQNQGKTYSEEFQQAYEFAYKHGITTMPTIEQANMEGPLTRIAMAKMLSYYAINVLGLKPDETRVNKFNDVSDQMDAEYNNAVTLAYQLGIMGINMPKNRFRPNDLVTRAEFATALSRMLYKIADGKDKYYSTHLAKLMEEKIITNDNPDLQELRGYVMIMLMRSAK